MGQLIPQVDLYRREGMVMPAHNYGVPWVRRWAKRMNITNRRVTKQSKPSTLSTGEKPLCHLMSAEADEEIDYSSDEEDEVEL